MSPERRAKGGLGCPVSHPEHGDTLRERGHLARKTNKDVFLPDWNHESTPIRIRVHS
ncbi:MAG: hypothetical protein [Olavius algarvensis Gamma 1 endosymbiont]|nr:MAG: hypothetical protein [Olavius algarvensis Gamma 1 endosymbiont]